jgi:hypothetical protein
LEEVATSRQLNIALEPHESTGYLLF